MERRLAAILVADAVGSTAAMERDEEGAVASIAERLSVVEGAVAEHKGRVFNTAGDQILAEFQSPVNALRAALAARARLAAYFDDPACLRYGLHLADVVALDGDLRGDGVNLAARLQAAVAPGEIAVTDALYAQVRRASPCRFHEAEDMALKGMSRPVTVYRVKSAMDSHRYNRVSTREAPVVARRPNSVAVAPFRTASSADDDQTFLAEGLTEDLILELSRLRELHVVSQTAVDALRGRAPAEAARATGAAFALSGSVRMIGEVVRLNVSLTNAETGEVIWSDRIQRPFAEVLDVMDEITSRVAATVFGRIAHAELAAAKLKRPENMTAYELYLRGLELHRLGGVTINQYREATHWFDRAIESDPTFARGYAMRVCAGSNLPEFDIEEGERMIQTALRLDPDDADAHRIMGMMDIRIHRDYPAARRHFERAMQLAPSNAFIVGRTAAFHIFDGDPEKGLALLDRAEALDPFLPVWVVEERVAAHYTMARFDEMAAVAKSLPFQTRRTRLYRAVARARHGELDRARRLIAAVIADDPAITSDYIRFIELYRDPAIVEELVRHAEAAGLPRPAAAPEHAA